MHFLMEVTALYTALSSFPFKTFLEPRVKSYTCAIYELEFFWWQEFDYFNCFPYQNISE